MCCVSVLSPKPSLWWHICMISMGDGEMQSLYITYTISQKLGRSCPMHLSLGQVSVSAGFSYMQMLQPVRSKRNKHMSYVLKGECLPLCTSVCLWQTLL